MQAYLFHNGPDHRELYLLAAGVIAGILLGPAVLGRVAPGAYHEAFPSVERARLELDALERSLADIRARQRQVGATDVAIIEFEAPRLARRQALQAEVERALRSRGRSTALLLAIAMAMILEAVLDSSRRVQRRRLSRARYALIATWIALVLAQPETLGRVPLPFLALLALLVLVAAAAPGGAGAPRGAAKANDESMTKSE